MTGVRDQISAALLKRRKLFATDIRDRINHYTPSLNSIVSSGDNSERFDDELRFLGTFLSDLTTLISDFQQRVDGFYDKSKDQPADYTDAFTTISKVDDNCNSLLCLDNRLKQVAGDFPSSVSSDLAAPRNDVLNKLTGKCRTTVDSVLQSLQNVRRRINPGLDRFAVGESAPNEVAEAVRQLNNLQLGTDTRRGQLLADFFTLMSSRSDLVAKLSSLLGDTQRRFLFAIFLAIRVLKLRRLSRRSLRFVTARNCLAGMHRMCQQPCYNFFMIVIF